MNHLLKNGSLTRKYINNEYQDRTSSGIVLILGSTAKFELTNKPTGLKIKVGNKIIRKLTVHKFAWYVILTYILFK